MKKNIISKIDLEAEKEALKQEKFRFDGQQEQYEEAVETEKNEQEQELEMLEAEYNDLLNEDYDNEGED